MGAPSRRLFALLALCAGLAAQDPQVPVPTLEPLPVLDRSTFVQHWRHVTPRPEELQWRAIPWLGTLGEAVARAQSQDRPILLWAMNGHPLACT
jgi:hypothetical protein